MEMTEAHGAWAESSVQRLVGHMERVQKKLRDSVMMAVVRLLHLTRRPKVTERASTAEAESQTQDETSMKMEEENPEECGAGRKVDHVHGDSWRRDSESRRKQKNLNSSEIGAKARRKACPREG